MKVKELIKRLSETNKENNVYLVTETKIILFSGISFDDIGDVQLFEVGGDKEA